MERFDSGVCLLFILCLFVCPLFYCRSFNISDLAIHLMNKVQLPTIFTDEID